MISKIIIIILSIFISYSCAENKNKEVKTIVTYPVGTDFLNLAASMRITIGSTMFWTLPDNISQIDAIKRYDFYDNKKYEIPNITKNKTQIMFEALNLNDDVIGVGISKVIDSSNLENVYSIPMLPVDKPISLESTYTGIDSNIKNLEGHTITKLPNGNILIWGGKDIYGYSSKIYVFHPETFKVTALGSNIPRAFHTATLYYLDTNDNNNPKEPRVLISGGINDSGDIDTAEIFNPENNTIEVIPAQSVSKGINQSSIVTSNGFVYLFGGRYLDVGVEKYSSIIISFNIKLKTFSGLANLPEKLENTTATYIGHGKAIIAGGNNENTVSNKVFLFNSSISEVSVIGTLTNPRTKHSAILYNGKVYFVGGFSTHSGNTFSSPVKDIEAATALETSYICDLRNGRGDATVNKINTNTIIIAGGHSGDNKPITNSQIVELRRETCMPSTKTIPLNNPRYGAKSVLTSTGLTLIVGGISDSNNNSASIMEVMSLLP